MKKKYLSLLLLSLLLVACSSGAKALPKEEASPYIDKAQTIIDQVSVQGFNPIEDQLTDEMKGAITEKISQQVVDDIAEKGDFQEYGSSQASKSEGGIVVQQEAKYKEGKVIFTVTFDGENKLAGFFYK